MMRRHTRRKVISAAAVAAALFPALPTRAATTLTWDADLTQPGAQGGPGAWTDGGPGWFDGTSNVAWSNANLDSALFTGTTAGAVTISGTTTAQYLTFDTPGYTLAGGTLRITSPGAGINSGVHANADVTINANIITSGFGSDGWIKDGPGTLTLGGDNFFATVPFHLKAGTLAFAAKQNPPRSITLDGDVTSRLLYTGGGTSVDIGTALNVLTVGRYDVPDAATTLNLVAEIRGTGTLIKEGAGAFAPTYSTTQFTGSVSVQGGTFALRSATVINARPVQLIGGTLSLQAGTATDFASPVTSRAGTGKTSTLAVGGPTPGGAHALPSLTHVSGTLNLTSTNNWTLTVASLTNGATIDLNNTRLTVTGAIAPFTGTAAGTLRFAHDPSTVTQNTTTRGLWLNTATSTTVTSTFAGQTEDADLLVGSLGSGTVATNLTLDGSWRGGGASATSTLVLPRHGNITFGPNFRSNNLPTDPAAAPRPFRIWGNGNTPGGTLTFDPDFVADHTANGTSADGLASIELSNVSWQTNHTQGLPVVTRTHPGSAATYRAGQITFDNFSNVSGVNSWTVSTNDQTYDGGLYVKQTGSIFLNKNLTLTGRASPYADNHLRIAANRTLSVGGVGQTLTLSGDLGFAPGSTLSGGTALLVLNTDPGAGWYDGNYARNPAAGTRTPPPAPSHTLKLSFGDLEGHGGAIFNAPVTRVAELSVGGTATVSLSLPGPQKVLSVSNKLSTFSSQFFTRYLDLTDNAMILGVATLRTPTSIRNLLAAGTLRSTAADADHALGYARAADVLTPGPGGTYTFLGLPVSSNDVLIRYTMFGDATLDGLVNFDDLLALAKHYNAATNTHWSAGDFNYDNVINFDDLLLLAKHYNAYLPTQPLAGAPAEFSADLATAFAEVPEPSAIGLTMAACGFALTARRRRHP